MEKHHAAYLSKKAGASQKEIARIYKVTENTVTAWSKKYKWSEKMEEEFLFDETAGENVRFLIQHDSKILRAIAERKSKVLEDINNAEIDDLQQALTNKGSVDALQKLFTTIKGKELDFEKVIKIVRELVVYVADANQKLAQDLQPYAHEYLNDKRKG